MKKDLIQLSRHILSFREITEGSASSAAHPESNTMGQNMLSLLQTFIQRLWEVILTCVWIVSPSLRLAESMKKEEMKIHTDGSLSIYQLPMKEEITLPQKMIAAKSIGEPGQFQEKVLLVVGATGAGKSSLINGIVNYIIGVKWEDDFRFKVAMEDVSNTESYMKYLTAYTFYPMRGSPLLYKLTVIDTPGFGHSEGLKRDKDIAVQIKEFFSIPPPNGVHHLDGIAFVTQASPTRLTQHQIYIFNSVLSMFGKDLCKNIFLMVTFSDHQKPPILQALNDANLAVSDKHFKFNNSVLFADNKDKDERSFDALCWKMSFQAFADFFTELSSAKSTGIELTKEVLTVRDKLQTLLEHMVQDAANGAKRVQNIWEDERWHTAQKCHVRLNEIAFRSTPVLSVDHLQLLIESEKQQGETGHAQRIEYLEEAKRQAEMLLKEEYRLAEAARLEKLKLNDGTPSIYKLQVKEELTNERKKIAKQSIGEPCQCQEQEKVLLLIGATGSGKSTLINGITNYIMGVKWEDDFRFQLVIDDPKVSKSRSQTQFITAYTFHPMEGSAVSYKLTVIDTPGFGDSEGLKRDKEITKQIAEFFSIPPPNGVSHLDGIGFVIQATQARLTTTQKYIFSSVLSIFGKDLSRNIFLMLTFADGQKPPVLNAIKDAGIPNHDKTFKFNNSALVAENKGDGREINSMFWKMGSQSLKAFFDEFSKAEGVQLEMTKSVLKERNQLAQLLEGLRPQINRGLAKIEEMRQEESVLQLRDSEIESNKEFTYTVEIIKPRQVDLSGKGIFTTSCLRCNSTCHLGCDYADDNEKAKCCAMDMSSGKCEICPEQCHWTYHKNLSFYYVFDIVEEERTSEDLKKKYESAKKGKTKVEGMIARIGEELEKMHQQVMRSIGKAQRCLHRLDEIALKPNPLTNVEYIELLIAAEKQTANRGWKQRINYLEEAKEQAEVLSNVKTAEAVEERIKETTHSGWYKRFKYWIKD